MRVFTLIPPLLHLAYASTPQKPLSDSQSEYGPSIEHAKENANLVFNAVYQSMRQWGSSIQHNGMSLFPAYIPEGTLLYHGDPGPDPPTQPDWIAFEIPHAESFAAAPRRRRRPGDGPGGGPRGPGNPPEGSPGPPGDDPEDDASDGILLDLRTMSPEQLLNLRPPDFDWVPGYLHIYQASRPLKVIYLDGMAAAKSERGTLDTQDILLLNLTSVIWDERARADGLCNLAKEWGVDGFIRMECGFELIKCDFSDGLDFISHRQRPDNDEPEGFTSMFMFEFVRDIGSRYNGIDAGRVVLDYSSMISAFFYPANLSNPTSDPRQAKYPRLVGTDKKVLHRIKSDVQTAVGDSSPTTSVNWQGVADMIVKRYAPRLLLMATGLSQDELLSEVNFFMNTFIHYGDNVEKQDPVEVCSMHFLQPVRLSTEQDHLIHASFKAVTHRICSTLFEIRTRLFRKRKGESTTDLDDKKSELELIQDLNTWLDWTDWTTCGPCAVNEVCFIAVFPWGNDEDHYHPQCKNYTQFNVERPGGDGDSYWMPGRKRPGF